jgi:hypothetical protein
MVGTSRTQSNPKLPRHRCLTRVGARRAASDLQLLRTRLTGRTQQSEDRGGVRSRKGGLATSRQSLRWPEIERTPDADPSKDTCTPTRAASLPDPNGGPSFCLWSVSGVVCEVGIGRGHYRSLGRRGVGARSTHDLLNPIRHRRGAHPNRRNKVPSLSRRIAQPVRNQCSKRVHTRAGGAEHKTTPPHLLTRRGLTKSGRWDLNPRPLEPHCFGAAFPHVVVSPHLTTVSRDPTRSRASRFIPFCPESSRDPCTKRVQTAHRRGPTRMRVHGSMNRRQGDRTRSGSSTAASSDANGSAEC